MASTDLGTPAEELNQFSPAEELNDWALLNGVQGPHIHVEHMRTDRSMTAGFCLRYKGFSSSTPARRTSSIHDIPIPGPDELKSWRDIDAIKNFLVTHESKINAIKEDEMKKLNIERPSSSCSNASRGSCASECASTSSLQSTVKEQILLRVPYDLVLCGEYVCDYAVASVPWRRVYTWMLSHGMDHPRYQITAFLCMSWVHFNTPDGDLDADKFPPHPWRRYVGWLPIMPVKGEATDSKGPSQLTVPTTWPEEDQKYLNGTTLEVVLRAKMKSLRTSFERLQRWAEEEAKDGSGDLEWIKQITISDWIRFDACFRSRSIETCFSGTAMVPCLDMANHSYNPKARFIQDVSCDILLLFTKGFYPGENNEITINYKPENGAGEFLSTYGFIPQEMRAAENPLPLTFTVDPEGHDETWSEKFKLYRKNNGMPLLTLDLTKWTCPFAYFMAAETELKYDESRAQTLVLFENQDVSHQVDKFQGLTNHPQYEDWKLFAIQYILLQLCLLKCKLEKAPKKYEERKVSSSRNNLRVNVHTIHQELAHTFQSLESAAVDALLRHFFQEEAELMASRTEEAEPVAARHAQVELYKDLMQALDQERAEQQDELEAMKEAEREVAQQEEARSELRRIAAITEAFWE